MSEWRILIEPPRSAREHMTRDEALALEGMPTVRLFVWDPPAVSLGFKQMAPDWCEAWRWRGAGLECVERPTGGGIALHGSDVCCSVVVPREMGLKLEPLMRAVCQSAVELCKSYGVTARLLLEDDAKERITYCLIQRSAYAVYSGERKLAGFALRRYPGSWLIQGSLLVQPLPRALTDAMPAIVIEQLNQQAVSLSEAAGTPISFSNVTHRWAEGFSTWWNGIVADVELVSDAV